MLRMTLILCAGMYAALLIAGVDRGQLRPGLANAAAKAALTGAAAAPKPDSDQEITVVANVPPVEMPAPASPAAAPPAAAATPAAAVALAGPEPDVVPEPYVEPERELVAAIEEPVFSLSALGNEVVPAGDAAAVPTPEVAAGGEGTIWYVNASSVNVRAEPSTDAEIVGRLASGEATLMVQAVDGDWARIVIQGDGVEGFVAIRYLSAEAP